MSGRCDLNLYSSYEGLVRKDLTHGRGVYRCVGKVIEESPREVYGGRISSEGTGKVYFSEGGIRDK